KVITGIHKDINVKIDGKVSFDKNVTGSGIVYSPTIQCSVDEYKNDFKYGTMEYGNKLFERYQQLEKLCQEYSGTIVGLNYEAEKTRLQNEMKKYGLYDEKNNSAVGKLSVDYIELPDMISSGGNIYIKGIDANKITGKGTLKAQGAPKIQIENNSNLYMIVNDLKIIEPGGDIILNDLSLDKKAKETIKGVANVETDASTGSLIDVKENWKTSYDVKYNNQDIKGCVPLTNIEINGNIVNAYGNVNFYNANKDIVLQGKTALDSASINGAAISISAPKGSIAQGYTQGITNIGYTPEFVLKKFAANNENALSKGVTSNSTKTDTKTLTEADMLKYIEEYKKTPEGMNDSASGVWLAGGMVFLNGDDINVNGTIQSGYSQFEVTLTNSDKARINSIKSRYEKERKPEVTDSYLSEYCRINESGMKWDAKTGTYKYVVQAYYNPQTDSIILEDIQSDGGKIYLTGRISNTGNGKIYAADGSSDINIINKTGKNLVAKTLDTGDRQGLISITDLGKNKDDKGNAILGTLTEMTSDSTKVWYLTSKGKSDKPNKTSGLSSVYNPQAGLTYNWSNGYDIIDEFRYDESYKFTVWGLIDYGKKTSNTLKEKVEKNQLTPSRKDSAKLPGTFIGTPKVDAQNGYYVYFNNNVDYKDGPRTGGYTHYNTIFHFSGTQYQWAIMKQGATEVFQHSIKADYPIQIKFISGNGNINLETNSNLTLNSDVISKYGKVNLTSSNGYIEQFGGNILTDNLWLKATTGIGANKAISQQMNSKSGVLSAITNSGDINLLSTNKAGLKEANLKFTATTDKGNVNVISDASLLKGGNALDVKGSRIDLVSNYGSVGAGNALLNIYAGQVLAKPGDSLSASVNANALGDVALNQKTGNMRIGKIVSKTGDVYLTSAGAILDALPPSGTEVQSQSAERLIEKWKQMGIISDDGSDNSNIKKQETLDNYKTIMNVSFQRYLDLKSYFDGNNETNNELYTEYQKLKEKFGNFTSLDKWLEDQNKDKNSDWYLLQNNTLYGWDQDSLLYAIQDSIINREEGSTVTPKSADDANIKGRNVYIKAGGGIGQDEGYTVVDISNFKSAEGLEALKKIAAAEASDVKWGYDGDKIDKNKATINNVNSIAIDAKGSLEAYAKGNIYLEDVNNNAINLISVKSDEGNVRVYGNNGVYNSTKYVEGNNNNIINLAGKDLIVEAGNGSIGSSTVPVTTNMSGFVTARSEGLINLYQLGSYALTFAAAYSGADINIRAISSIYSVYNGEQADELGYINAKGNISLLSDKGDIGQANGKGLRVRLAEGKVLNAEADSIYIKGYGDNKNINLGKFKARKGNIGLDSKLWDVFLKNDISANNIELIVRSLTQLSGKLTVNNLLKVISDNGIMLSNAKNHIPEAYIVNNKSGVVGLNTDTDLTLHKAINLAVDSAMTIFANGSINSLDVIESFGSLFIWSKGNINSSNDLMAKDWMGLYAENGGINVKGGLTANAIDLSVDENGLTADGIYSDSYIKANVELGDIIINGNVKATEGSIDLVTELGDVKFDNVEAKEDIKVAAYFGKELEFKTINSKEGSVEAVSFGSLTGDSINAGKDFYVASILDLNLNKLVGGPSDSDTLSYLFGKNVKIDSITVDNKFEALSDKLDVND
ncbi:MAG: hypothetical protein J6Z11_06935, partial [Candidatus Riflebacteria bacterium]|nr:hypothetical protein [Candidatus Riflebacteria bacterium]